MTTQSNESPTLSEPEIICCLPTVSRKSTIALAVSVDSDEGPDQRMSFMEAARTGDEEIVRALLKKRGKNNISIRTQDITKAILEASRGGHEEVVCELLNVAGYTYVDSYVNAYGRTALQAAAEGGYTSILLILLKAGANINALPSEPHGRTALQAGAGCGHLETVKTLLNAGADVNAQPSNDNGRTALQAAAEGGHLPIFDLLKAKANVNAPPSQYWGRTALQAAAGNGHSQLVKDLLRSGAKVNAPPSEYFGRTALQAAAEGGHMEVLSVLLKADADINAQPSSYCGRTALQAAAGCGHLDIVLHLIEAGARINASPSYDHGRTALQAAAEGGHAEVVSSLLAEGAEINAHPSPRSGRTALQAAASSGHAKIVDILLGEGAEINANPSLNRGRTALQAAAENGHEKIISILLSAGADVNANPSLSYGKSALQGAAGSGYLGVVSELLNRGAKPNALPSNHCGRTALQAAAEGGHTDIVSILLDAKADVNANPSLIDGKTALRAAAEGGYANIVSTLLDAGVNITDGSTPNHDARAALDMAIQGGRANVVDMLIAAGVGVSREAIWQISGRPWNGGYEEVMWSLVKAGADINAPAFEQPAEALLFGLGAGRADIWKVLIEVGANIQPIPPPKDCLLSMSAGAGHGEVVQLLLNAGSRSNSAIWFAAAAGHEDVVQILLRAGVDINATNEYGSTCLSYAICHPNVVRTLLENDAEVNVQDSSGATPLHQAALAKSAVSLDLLLKAGAKTESEDYENRRPLDILLHSPEPCGLPLVRLLLENGSVIQDCRLEHLRKLLQPGPDDCVMINEDLVQCSDSTQLGGLDSDHPSKVRISGKLVTRIGSVEPLPQFDVAKPAGSMVERRLYAGSNIFPRFRSPYLSQLRYPAPMKQGNEAVGVEWSWFLLHEIRQNDQQTGIGLPKLGNLIAPNKRAFLNCYACFEFLERVVDPGEGDNDRGGLASARRKCAEKSDPGKRFMEKVQTSKIAWTMRRRDINFDVQPQHAVDADFNPIFRTEEFRSTLDIGRIPDSGLEFFTLFVANLHEKWRVLLEDIDKHLSSNFQTLLRNKGETPGFIEKLLHDAQKWNNFQSLLQDQVRKARGVVRDFEEKQYLSEEVVLRGDKGSCQCGGRSDKQVAIGKQSGSLEGDKSSCQCGGRSDRQMAIDKLSAVIKDMESEVEAELQKYVKKTKGMIQFELNLVSVNEARASMITGMSMKRLSWITFFFLPLMFVASVFGMNIDVINGGPHWTWVIWLSISVFGFVILVWIFLKLVPIDKYIAKKWRIISQNLRHDEEGSVARRHHGDLELGRMTERNGFEPPPRQWDKLKVS